MAGVNSPIALQALLGDIGSRRAIAAALRAREQSTAGTGEMVSGRYVPNLQAAGGALARGLFGDPMDALRQEEQQALQSYGDELAGATQDVLGADGAADDADFARRIARGQTAGVPQDVMRGVLDRRQSMRMFDDSLRMLDRMGQAQQPVPSQGVAAGGGEPGAGVRGAPPIGGMPPPPAGGPPQGGNDAFARAVGPGGGVVPEMAGIPESKLLLLAVTMPTGHPMGALVEAEIKARKLENKDGVLTRNGQFVGKLTPDGMFIDPQGNAVNLAGAAKAAQAGAEMKAQEAAKAGFRTATVTGPDGTKSGYEQDIYGTPPALRGQGGASPAGNPSARFSYDGTVGGAQQALGAVAADQAGGMGGGVQDVPGGGRVVAGPNPMAVKQREADINATAGGREKLYQDQAAALSKGLDGARQAAEVGLPTIQTVRGILDSGKVNTGMGANVALQLGRALKAAGVSDADGVEATQSFAVTSAKRVMALLSTGALGRTQISDADRKFMERAAAADITLDERTIRRVLDIDEKAQRAAIESHNRNVDRSKSFFQSPDQEAFYRVEMPAPFSSPRAAGSKIRDPKVEQYLKQYGGQ